MDGWRCKTLGAASGIAGRPAARPFLQAPGTRAATEIMIRIYPPHGAGSPPVLASASRGFVGFGAR
jgi:hypothetical protein